MGNLRIGIIGTGVMGADHAHNLANGVRNAELVAIADVDEARTAALASEVGVERTFSDGGELIHSGEVDAVIVAAPDRFHAGYVLDCLDAGVPVLCEKPLAPTSAEARSVVDAQAGLAHHLVTVGFMRRFDPGYRAMRARLEAGTDGQLLMTHSVHRNVEAHPGGNSAETVTNSAIHEIDTLPWLAGAEIVRVEWKQGRASSLIDSRTDPQFLLMTDAAGVLHTVELQVHAQYGYDVRCEMVCERASVELPRVPGLVEGDPLLVSSGLAASVSYPADWRPRFAAAYRAELDAWVQATLRGELPDQGATAEDALRATIVAETLVESMDNGGVAIDVPGTDKVVK